MTITMARQPKPAQGTQPMPDTTPLNTPLNTPDNTPLPGGGRFRWDEALPGWVDQDAQPAAQTNLQE